MRESTPRNHGPHFSGRTEWEPADTESARTLTEKQRSGEMIYDLTLANPTACGFEYDAALLEPLQSALSLHYAPEPLGLLRAREAICTYYRDHRQSFDPPTVLELAPHQVLLTTGTSEAYSFLFRLLCDPGDEILIAQPSYPLFDFLAVLDDVKLVSYPLFYDYGWHIDHPTLEKQITKKTRAIVIVHPNNPTGHFTSQADRRALEKLCGAHNMALIIDEVFLDYSHTAPQPSFTLDDHPVLTFVLSGLSKVAGLPQMKLSWIAATGPEPELGEALRRLEIIADTFLSANAPIQYAAPVWLGKRHVLQQQIRARVAENLNTVDRAMLTNKYVDRLAVEGGWYAILRTPALLTGEDAAFHLLSRANVVVHPGVFFGLADSGWIVLSLLAQCELFHAGIGRLFQELSPAAQ